MNRLFKKTRTGKSRPTRLLMNAARTAFPITCTCFCLCLMIAPASVFAMDEERQEVHVSVNGDDQNDGSATAPLATIGAAAERAQPGDTITVHEGVYRERVNPVRGGDCDRSRIVFRVAPGGNAVIKGSERITGWVNEKNDAWKVVLPNEFFGDFNPYADAIFGDWFNPEGRKHHTGAVYLNEHWLTEAAELAPVLEPAETDPLWFARVDEEHTTIWAQFKDVDPNEAKVEINVRRTVFYPEKPGVDYITVRGFTMMHAATPWAPPTAEQIGLIGTHWSRGWIIEDNDISYSTCVGVTLGKHGDKYDNTSADTAEGYVETIRRARDNHGWSKETIGHHIVRNNRISHCEQAGLVGSLGAVFSEISGNVIHDIHVRRLFSGHEMAGIKIHGAVDFLIRDNLIYRTYRGIWLDWMTQGARISGNVFFDNGPEQDIYFEVNHGPYVVDNNLFLSPRTMKDRSQGGVYAHNLFAGSLKFWPELYRETPYLKPHSTEVAGFGDHPGGDTHFFNNIFIESELDVYDDAEHPMRMAGNVYLRDAKPARHEKSPLVAAVSDPKIELIRENSKLLLRMLLDRDLRTENNVMVTSDLLGEAVVPGVPFLDYDGSPLRVDTDYFGNPRDSEHPFPGPFESPGTGKIEIDLTKPAWQKH